MRLLFSTLGWMVAFVLAFNVGQAQAKPINDPSYSLPVVQTTGDSTQKMMLGFMVVGTDSQMREVERAAESIGLEHGQASNDKSQKEVMVFFKESVPLAKSLALYSRALDGGFGSVVVEVLVHPKLLSGEEVDTDAVRVFDAANIRIVSPHNEKNLN